MLTVDQDALILHYKILCALDPIKVLDHIAKASGVQLTFVTKMAFSQVIMEVT